MVSNIKYSSTITKSILITLLFGSCLSQSSTNKNVVDKTDTVLQDTVIIDTTKRILKDTVIKLDSLKDPKVKDSINLISSIAIKRKMTDSARRALDKKPKHVYLTFDDGPLIGSKAIDSIITSRNIKISAFLIGKHANMSKHLKKSYQLYYNNPLVDCYNHSFSHANNRFQTFYGNPQKALEDFEKNETDLELKYKIVRMPGRNIWYYDDVRRIDLPTGGSTADLLHKSGYKIYGWDVEWRINGVTGKPVQTVDQVYKRIKNFMNNKSSLTPNNVVLLMHDDMFQNKHGQSQLNALLDSLQMRTDYQFEFIRDYPFKYN